MHAYVEVNFPSDSIGEEDQYVEFIAADVFLRRLIIRFPPQGEPPLSSEGMLWQRSASATSSSNKLG
jgi:hypothetical protein